MSDAEFQANLLSVRLLCDRMRTAGASVDQLVSLGAELRAQQVEILEAFRLAGKPYSPPPWV